VRKLLSLIFAGCMAWQVSADIESDSLAVEGGVVEVTFIGHGTLMFEYDGRVIHVDPVGREADYRLLPEADLILVTHQHSDHLDARAIRKIRRDDTIIVHNSGTDGKIDGGTVLENGESLDVFGIRIEAVPAYNTTGGRDRFHPKGRDNGYIMTMGGKRFYVAGDTEDHTEMRALEEIYVAFLPANQPYTMTPEQVVDAAKAFRPEILYPYHFGNTDVDLITTGLLGEPGIEVRIRDMK
jgi:L-ascorbate metabolism protein UlaG (beta-lactamase superfamily)